MLVSHASSFEAHRALAGKETWTDFLVSAWVLFIAFALCGIVTFAGFPIGWSELGADSSPASADVASHATVEAAAVAGVGR